MHKLAKLMPAILISLALCSAMVYAQAGSEKVESAEDAISRTKTLVAKDPRSVEALCGLADSYTRKFIETGGKDDRLVLMATKLAIEARRINRRSALPHISMARAFVAQHKTDQAIQRAAWAAKLDSQNPKVKELLSELKITQGDAAFVLGFKGLKGIFEDEDESTGGKGWRLLDAEDIQFIQKGDLESLVKKHKTQLIIAAIVVVVVLLLLLWLALFLVFRTIRLFGRVLRKAF
jgi:hypothetical protein